MHTAVIIPYRAQANHDTLRWTLEGFAKQRLSPNHTLDVLVGIDGAEKLGENLPNVVNTSPHRTMICYYPAIGAAAVRNALVAQTEESAQLLIFANADARPDQGMVQCHADTMCTLPARSLVLGSAPWERLRPTVFDALVDDMPMIFSYCHARPQHWYPFRVAYSLNLSVRREDFEAVGGFPADIRPYYYEDLAFGCRVVGPERSGIYYEPGAQVSHRHPMTWAQYLDREELLGMMAPVLGRVCPEAFTVLMSGKSVIQLTQDFREKLSGDPAIYRRIYERLQERFVQPVQSLGLGEDRRREVERLYQLHIPVRLLAFRLGFLKGVEVSDDRYWKERRPLGLWRRALAVDE